MSALVAVEPRPAEAPEAGLSAVPAPAPEPVPKSEVFEASGVADGADEAVGDDSIDAWLKASLPDPTGSSRPPLVSKRCDSKDVASCRRRRCRLPAPTAEVCGALGGRGCVSDDVPRPRLRWPLAVPSLLAG